MQVLVLGSGGREHALVWRFSRDPAVEVVHACPGNVGMKDLATLHEDCPLTIPAVLSLAQNIKPDLVVIGPEQLMFDGFSDALRRKNFKVFGPSQEAARLEGSKAWSKHIMQSHNIPTAQFETFNNPDDASRWVKEMDRPCVVKVSGPALGKGVHVCHTVDEALQAIDAIMRQRSFGEAGSEIVIEELLEGEEASVFALMDGETIALLPALQDHKTIGEGDTGPMTGGMGAYSPVTAVTDAVLDQVSAEVLVPLAHAMNKLGHPYQGVLFVGLMLTAEGPKVIEFNCRFGDPEMQVLALLWEEGFSESLLACAQGEGLSEVTLKFSEQAAATVVMASEGYPASYPKGRPIEGLADDSSTSVVFHAGTKWEAASQKIVTAGGRVLAASASGDSLKQALAACYQRIDGIHFEGAQLRRDIGHRALNQAEVSA